jgi:hypothetical protein
MRARSLFPPPPPVWIISGASPNLFFTRGWDPNLSK